MITAPLPFAGGSNSSCHDNKQEITIELLIVLMIRTKPFDYAIVAYFDPRCFIIYN